MPAIPFPFQPRRLKYFLVACVAATLVALPSTLVNAWQNKRDPLRIGTSGNLTGAKEGPKEKAALTTLQAFIKDETGMNDEIIRQQNWRELAEKMAKGDLQLGVFQGYEFAWAQEQTPGLKPLAVAVNVHVYPVAYVVARRNDSAKDFAGLQGQSLSIPDTGEPFLRLFAEHECQANGKDLKSFFAKMTSRENVEDCIDDVVDGSVQATVVDRAALEAYRQSKPGRFAQLKEIAKSPPFPPAVIASYDKVLEEKTLKHFRDSLLNAANTERGKTMLMLFRLTSFEAVPADFSKVLAATRKTYPPPKAQPSK